jgi:hypothetical protein
VDTQHQAITFLSGFQKDLLIFLVFEHFFHHELFIRSIKGGCPSEAVGNVNRQNLQMTGITVKTVKNTKVALYFADINLVTGTIGSS